MKSLFQRWFPSAPDRARVAAELSEFYRNNAAYHKMTGSDDKTLHPQVALLNALVDPGMTYAEVGCGGGRVSNFIGRQAQVVGVDYALIALNRAMADRANGNVYFVNASGAELPLRSGAVDGCYAFEVLEHVWDPVRVCAEMVRIVKPGGFVLISVPLFFSLDLHLAKKTVVRLVETCFAFARFVTDVITGKPFRTVQPDLGDVYPDCDLITAINPRNFTRVIEKMGCRIIFRDTTYMCAHRAGSGTDLAYQKNTAGKFVGNFGDHLLLLARKK